MPVTALDVTPGGSGSNAYVTLAVAEQYHLDRPAAGTTWSGASTDQKNAAILWATKLLDSLIDWTGWVTSSTQALLWPRVGMLYRSGYSVPSSIIPIELQYATAEFARQLLAADRAGDSDVETQGLRALRAGPVSLEFKDSVYAKVVPDAVWSLLPASWGTIRGRVAGTRELLRA